MIFVMVVLFGFNISIVNAQEEDTFQQVINYLMLGDPHQRHSDLGTARINNRKDCISGFDYSDEGGYFKMNWLHILFPTDCIHLSLYL